jgi:DNA-directed RNA polymerase subunit M/transcription elongation factor TFIIS
MTCPGCGAKLKAPDEAVGRKTTCPKCKTSLTVPEPVYEAEAAPGPSPVDMYGLDDPAPLPPRSSGESASGGEARRPCPMCGEMILASAAKCRYCGEVFDPKLKKAEAKTKKKRRSSDASADDMSAGDWVVAILCSTIGCIAGIIWMIQGKPKGKKMFLVSFTVNVIFGILRYVLVEMAKQQPNM